MMAALSNVVAVVTGAGDGIGRELCKALKAAGAEVDEMGLRYRHCDAASIADEADVTAAAAVTPRRRVIGVDSNPFVM